MLITHQSMWAELSGENSRSPLTWVFAPPLKVTADRSAHFRSPLTYNFIPLRWNRSTLAHILNSSACLTPAVFNRSLGTHCLRDGRGAGLLRNCCGKIRFTSILSRGRGCGVFGPRTRGLHGGPETRGPGTRTGSGLYFKWSVGSGSGPNLLLRVPGLFNIVCNARVDRRTPHPPEISVSQHVCV